MPEPSAHDAAMAAKVDAAVQNANVSVSTPMGVTPAGATPAPAPDAKPRPEHIPEKFWDAAKGEVNVEAMAKSYVELEKTRTPAQEPAKEPAKEPAQADPAKAAEAVAAAKLDMSTLQQEFQAGGKLSDDSYAKLAAAGFDKAVVDAHIAGQVALAQQRDSEGFNLAGGQESFGKMTAWAQTALAPADIEAFNSAVTGTPAQMKQAITALKAQYEAAVGKDPALVSGGSAGDNSGEQPFASRAEVTTAMRDSRYKADPAYRAMVERRVGLMENF
jgi:hypothetical protein